MRKTIDSTIGYNLKRYSGIDGNEISDYVIDSHNSLYNDIIELRKEDNTHIPVTMATIPQIRMTRRLVGIYTMDDTEIKVDYDDSVGAFADWRKIGPVYKLPFSTLYGKEIKNLLVAGRCISVTDSMWDITRVIPVCAVSGQAAGTAAAMCDDFANINIKQLQKKLIKDGVHI